MLAHTTPQGSWLHQTNTLCVVAVGMLCEACSGKRGRTTAHVEPNAPLVLTCPCYTQKHLPIACPTFLPGHLLMLQPPFDRVLQQQMRRRRLCRAAARRESIDDV